MLVVLSTVVETVDVDVVLSSTGIDVVLLLVVLNAVVVLSTEPETVEAAVVLSSTDMDELLPLVVLTIVAEIVGAEVALPSTGVDVLTLFVALDTGGGAVVISAIKRKGSNN